MHTNPKHTNQTEQAEIHGNCLDSIFLAHSFSAAISNQQSAGAIGKPEINWSNYVRGAVVFAQWKLGVKIKHGLGLLIDSTIPANSGAFSSSARTMSAGAQFGRQRGLNLTWAAIPDFIKWGIANIRNRPEE